MFFRKIKINEFLNKLFKTNKDQKYQKYRVVSGSLS